MHSESEPIQTGLIQNPVAEVIIFQRIVKVMFPQLVYTQTQWMKGLVCDRPIDSPSSDGLHSNTLLPTSQEKLLSLSCRPPV